MEFCLKGKTYQSERLTDAVAALSTPFGRLKMEPEELEENVKVLMGAISMHKQTGGKFIARATITCPTSVEEFYIDQNSYTPKQSKPARHGKKRDVDESDEKVEEIN